MSQFLIAPWEHALLETSAKPHATARLSIGGKARNFLLKLRGDTLFFKEPSRAAQFALTQPLDSELARDATGLVSRWMKEVSANNYGVLVSKRDYFPKLSVRAQITMLVRPDGSGWMREHFDDDWFSLPEDKRAELDVWNDKAVEAHIRERLPFVQRALINRVISEEIRQRETPIWQSESGGTIAELLVAGARVFVEPTAPWTSEDWRLLKLKSYSAFAGGDIEGHWLKHALHSPRFAAFWKVLEPQIRFVGVRWSEGGEWLEQYGRTRNETIFQAGLEKWGREWRGNWAPRRASYTISLPDLSNQTAHEKMEAALVLREWLRGKMGEIELESLFTP